jgi:hypothetical protein
LNRRRRSRTTCSTPYGCAAAASVPNSPVFNARTSSRNKAIGDIDSARETPRHGYERIAQPNDVYQHHTASFQRTDLHKPSGGHAASHGGNPLVAGSGKPSAVAATERSTLAIAFSRWMGFTRARYGFPPTGIATRPVGCADCGTGSPVLPRGRLRVIADPQAIGGGALKSLRTTILDVSRRPVLVYGQMGDLATIAVLLPILTQAALFCFHNNSLWHHGMGELVAIPADRGDAARVYLVLPLEGRSTKRAALPPRLRVSACRGYRRQ